jgi:hypothetical protein
MTSLTIGLDADAPVRFRHAVATLPRSFGVVEESKAAAVIVGGATGWTDRARRQLDEGRRAVLVGDPVPEDAHALRASAIDAGALIMLAPVGAHDPGLDAIRERVGASDGGLLECRVITSPSASHPAMTVAMLALIRSVDSALVEVDATSSDAHGFHAIGRLESGRDVLLAADVCEAVAPVARLRVISSSGLVEADLPLNERSRPARVRTIGDSGEWHAERVFVSPARAVLERLHSAITQTETLDDLEAFLDDESLAHRLGWA